MKKKVVCFTLSLLVLLVFTGCGSSHNSNRSTQDNNSSQVVPSVNAQAVEVTKKNFMTYDDYGTVRTEMCCEYKNISSIPIIIKEISFKLNDLDKVSLGDSTHCVFAPEVLQPGEVGYATCNSGVGFSVTDIEQPAELEVSISSKEFREEVSNSLVVTDPKIIDYPYNTAHTAAQCIAENPLNMATEYIDVTVGLFDSSGTLIGVVNGTDNPSISAGGKAQVDCGAGWSQIVDWNNVSNMTATGRVVSFKK